MINFVKWDQGNRLAKKLSYSDSHVKTTLAQADTRDTGKVGGGQPHNSNFESLCLIWTRPDIGISRIHSYNNYNEVLLSIVKWQLPAGSN